MSKYCMQCGKQIDDVAKHCPFCGSSQEMGFDAVALNKNNNKKRSSILVPAVAIVSVILVVIIVVLNLTILNDSYEKPIENFFEAIEESDGDYFIDALPDYIDADYKKMDNLATIMSSSMQLMAGEDFEIDYEILNKTKIDKKELEKLEKSIKKDYDEKVNVSAGYELNVKISVEGDEKGETIKNEMSVYKIDGKWCLTDELSSDMF